MQTFYEFITVRGRFTYGDKDELLCTEFSGTPTLLDDSPRVVIHEDGTTNLYQFLADSILDGTYVTIKGVVVEDLDKLFDDAYIVSRWQDNRRMRTINKCGQLRILAHYPNGEKGGSVFFENTPLGDIIQKECSIDKTIGAYVYMEIYVHKKK